MLADEQRDPFWELIQQAQISRQNDDIDSARECLEQASAFDDQASQNIVIENQGLLYYQQGDKSSAYEQFNSYLQSASTFAIHIVHFLFLAVTQDDENAQATLEGRFKAITSQGNYDQLLTGGQAIDRDFIQASEDLTSLYTRTQSPYTLWFRGLVHRHNKDWQLAIADYQAAADIQPDNLYLANWAIASHQIQHGIPNYYQRDQIAEHSEVINVDFDRKNDHVSVVHFSKDETYPMSPILSNAVDKYIELQLGDSWLMLENRTHQDGYSKTLWRMKPTQSTH